MQATCENCGKTITPEDFSRGRYFLFWITPTIPTDSLYLCEECRGLSWPERERLYERWQERQHAPRPAKRRRPRKRRKAAHAPAPASLWGDSDLRRKPQQQLAPKTFELT